MNGQAPNREPWQPPQQSGMPLENLIQIRLALDTVKHPSKELKDAINKLDGILAAIINSFQPLALPKGPTQ